MQLAEHVLKAIKASPPHAIDFFHSRGHQRQQVQLLRSADILHTRWITRAVVEQLHQSIGQRSQRRGKTGSHHDSERGGLVKNLKIVDLRGVYTLLYNITVNSIVDVFVGARHRRKTNLEGFWGYIGIEKYLTRKTKVAPTSTFNFIFQPNKQEKKNVKIYSKNVSEYLNEALVHS